MGAAVVVTLLFAAACKDKDAGTNPTPSAAKPIGSLAQPLSGAALSIFTVVGNGQDGYPGTPGTALSQTALGLVSGASTANFPNGSGIFFTDSANNGVFSTSTGAVIGMVSGPGKDSRNLIANAGGEYAGPSAAAAGWSGSGWTADVPESLSGAPDPLEGNAYLIANPLGGTLSQDIDLSAFAASIDAGTQEFVFSGYSRVVPTARPDSARIRVVYSPASGAFDPPVVYDGGSSALTSDWNRAFNARIVPAGTRVARIELIAQPRVVGARTTSPILFDAFSLVAVKAGAAGRGLSGPTGVSAFGPPVAGGRAIVADTYNHQVVQVVGASVAVNVTRIAGTLRAPSNVVNRLHLPTDAAVDPATQHIYIADFKNHRIVKVADTVISVFAGTGIAGFSGDGGPAASAQLNYPSGVAVSGSGEVFIADRSNRRIRRVDAAGIITTFAGTGIAGRSGDDGPATAAAFTRPWSVDWFDGALYVSDIGNHDIRRIRNGIIELVAGTGAPRFSSDGAATPNIGLWNPTSIQVTTGGSILVADTHNRRVRTIGCSDNLFCNGIEGFANGQCTPGTPPLVSDGNPCTADLCAEPGQITHANLPDGTPCGAASPGRCGGGGVCAAGQCGAGPPVAVDDHDACTVDSCDPATGNPVHTPKPLPEDGNPCTVAVCDPATGNVAQSAAPGGTACDDDTRCNGRERCVLGACMRGQPLELSDANECTRDVCNAATGAVSHEPLAQGTSCSAVDRCHAAGSCDGQGHCAAGPALAVGDANPCTADSCDPVSGIVAHTPLPAQTACDDVTLCNGRETCTADGRCVSGPAPTLSDGDPCTADVCDPASGVQHPKLAAGASCSDGNACNGAEACTAAGACVAGQPPIIDDGKPCTVDRCNPGSGTVDHTPLAGGSACEDGNLCNGTEICDGGGNCLAGTAPNLDDGNACTVDSCDPLSGVRHAPADTATCGSGARWVSLAGSRPAPRDGAAGVFLGTGELLLFGGNNAGAVLGDAWLWSPATRAWRRAASGPPARAGASLAFDAQRRRAVLFGGVTSASADAQYLNDLWEYDAATNVWTPRPPSGGSTPPARALASFAFDSQRQRGLLFGGSGATTYADTWEWNAAQSSWTQLSGTAPSARYGAAFAFDPTSSRYALFGGSPGNMTGALADTWVFSATTGQWSRPTASVSPPARAGAGMTFDAQASRVVLFGGSGVSEANLTDTWELNAQTGLWTQIATASSPSAVTGAVLGFDELTRRTFALAGLSYSASGRFTPQAISVSELDRASASWLERSTLLAPPALNFGVTYDSDRKEAVAIGTFPPPERPLMWAFQSASSSWSAKDVTDVSSPFSAGEFIGAANGTNALHYSSSLRRVLQLRIDKLMQWDGQRWSTRCDLTNAVGRPLRVADPGVAFDSATRRVFVYGGTEFSTLGQPMRRDFRVLDAETCAISSLSGNAPPPARNAAAVVWDSDRRRLIVFGGAGLSGASLVGLGDTWEFDPATQVWSSIAGPGPSARNQPTAIFDPVRKRVVLHGGSTLPALPNVSPLLFDTWEYDTAARTWTKLDTLGPSAGEQAALTFDDARKLPMLVSTRGAVWHLSGGVWRAAVNALAPAARSGMSGGFSPVSGVGIFFGGTSGDGQRDFLADTWLWRDGWRSEFSGAGSSLIAYGQGELDAARGDNLPAARTGHVLATGSVRNPSSSSRTHVPLLFGGEGASDKSFGLFADTWTFDEQRMEWQQLSGGGPVATPRGRTGHALAVFPNRGYLMFGGLGRTRVTDTSSNPARFLDTLLADTFVWELSTSAWRELGSTGGLTARYGHAIATDESTNKLVLFGGRTATGVSAETWTLNLATTSTTAAWRKVTPPTSPIARFGHSMTFDPVRRRVVLTGGEGIHAQQTFGDTWEWDSTAERWTQRNVPAFDGRAGHVTFFDRSRGQLIAFGGFAHRDSGRFAMTHGDTLAFTSAGDADPVGGFPNAASCTSASQCGSGNCVDGVCCNAPCASQCAACDVPGSEGTCSAVRGAVHGTRTSCGASTGECSPQCNGVDMTACRTPAAGTSCGPAIGCTGTTLVTGQATCDGISACIVPQVSCVPYRCCEGTGCPSPSVCHSTCFGNLSCAVGFKCSIVSGPIMGSCYEPPVITAFTSTPASARVGVPMTFTAVSSVPNTRFRYLFSVDNGLFQSPPGCPTSTTPTCSWTPSAAEGGKSVNFRVIARAAANTGNTDDDEESLTFIVGQP